MIQQGFELRQTHIAVPKHASEVPHSGEGAASALDALQRVRVPCVQPHTRPAPVKKALITPFGAPH